MIKNVIYKNKRFSGCLLKMRERKKLTNEEKNLCYTFLIPIILSLLFLVFFFLIKYSIGINLRNYINIIPFGTFLVSLVYSIIILKKEVRILNDYSFKNEKSKRNIIKYLNLLLFCIIAGLFLILKNTLISWLFWNAENWYLRVIVSDVAREIETSIKPIIIIIFFYVTDDIIINRIKATNPSYIHSILAVHLMLAGLYLIILDLTVFTFWIYHPIFAQWWYLTVIGLSLFFTGIGINFMQYI